MSCYIPLDYCYRYVGIIIIIIIMLVETQSYQIYKYFTQKDYESMITKLMFIFPFFSTLHLKINNAI